jgi:integrase
MEDKEYSISGRIPFKVDLTDKHIYDSIGSAEELGISSRKSYVEKLKRAQKICRAAFGDRRLSLTSILLQPTKTLAALEGSTNNIRVLSNHIQALLAVMKHAKEFLILSDEIPLERLTKRWNTIFSPIATEVETLKTSGEPSEKVSLSILPWSRVYDKNISLRKKAFRTLDEEDVSDMILSDMYVLLEPRRVIDYARVFVRLNADQVVPQEATGFIDLTLEKPTISITTFKTHKFEGDWTKELPRQLVKDVRLSMKVNPREYLFMTSSGKKFDSSDTFSTYHRKRLLEWFGIPATPTTLRHSRATQVTADPTLSLKEKMDIAKDMSHSLKMHMTYAYKPKREKDGSFEIIIFDPIKKRFETYACARKV